MAAYLQMGGVYYPNTPLISGTMKTDSIALATGPCKH